MTDQLEQQNESEKNPPEGGGLSLNDLKKMYGLNKGNIFEGLIQKIESGAELENNHLKTGFSHLDNALGGGISGLSVLGGMPGVGKTSFALQLGMQVAEKTNVPFIIYSLEMSRERLIHRLLSICCDMSLRELFSGSVEKGSDGKQVRIFKSEKNKDRPVLYKRGRNGLRALIDRILIIDKNDTGAWSLEEYQYEIKEKKHQTKGIKNQISSIMEACKSSSAFVVIDHLQVFPLIRYIKDGSGELKRDYRSVDERERLVALMDSFSRIQQNLGISFLLISQMNRQAYNGLTLGAFMGSASIEYIVDIGMALVEPNGKKSGSSEENSLEEWSNLDKQVDRGPQKSRRVDLVILKNRDGIIGKIPLKFYPDVTRFAKHQ